jgi:hypothetical protein
LRVTSIAYFELEFYWVGDAVQGNPLNVQEIQRIVSLLSETQMSMPEIAMRMRCSRSTIVSVNRRYRVREYGGFRSKWEIYKASEPTSSQPTETQEVVSPGLGANESMTAA